MLLLFLYFDYECCVSVYIILNLQYYLSTHPQYEYATLPNSLYVITWWHPNSLEPRSDLKQALNQMLQVMVDAHYNYH